METFLSAKARRDAAELDQQSRNYLEDLDCVDQVCLFG